MSELKAIRSGEIYNIIEYEDCYRTDDLYYPKSEADKVIAEKDKEIARLDDLAHAHNIELLRKENLIEELEESHKKEVEQLLMRISKLKKLVETADKLLKPKGGFTIKNVTFGGVELEGIKTQRSKHD